MAVRTIIPGPPGTGKTYRLVNHYLSNEINSLQTNAQRIIYITFSKAAAKEARERIETLFPNQDFLYISTMHSLGTRECGINTSERLLNGKKKWHSPSVAVAASRFVPTSGASPTGDTG